MFEILKAAQGRRGKWHDPAPDNVPCAPSGQIGNLGVTLNCHPFHDNVVRARIGAETDSFNLLLSINIYLLSVNGCTPWVVA